MSPAKQPAGDGARPFPRVAGWLLGWTLAIVEPPQRKEAPMIALLLLVVVITTVWAKPR